MCVMCFPKRGQNGEKPAHVNGTLSLVVGCGRKAMPSSLDRPPHSHAYEDKHSHTCLRLIHRTKSFHFPTLPHKQTGKQAKRNIITPNIKPWPNPRSRRPTAAVPPGLVDVSPA